MGMITVNGTELYHEARGSGPTLLMIAGATGDAGHWTEVADKLADAFTVITYDRRGNSRSPAPAGWSATSIAEQADDAAGLLRALDLAPAAVVGSSLGALIACSLLERHPGVVRRAVLHEPPLHAVVSDGPQVAAALQTLIEKAVAEGGLPCALDRFLRWVCGDAVVDSVEPRLRERMVGNCEVFFGVELPAMASYLPDAERMRASGITIIPAAGVDNRGMYLHEGTAWLAAGLGVDLVEMAGAHVPYFDRPAGFADELRTLLEDAARTIWTRSDTTTLGRRFI
jgi:pimeloyl-ACP methyl ester carboxylesterase